MTQLSRERVRAYYQREADRYDSAIAGFERLFLGDARRWAASQARGDVLEIGIGTGRNLPFYAVDTRLVGIDMSAAMLAVARQRAQLVGRSVDLRVAHAESLSFVNESLDAVVCTLVLCCMPNPQRAINEMARVLKPGAKLVMVEHVRSPVWPVRLVQQVLEPISLRTQADDLLRDPLDYLADLPLTIELLERSKWGVIERLVARKAAAN
jgi:ubiquinone/menaquinone biosynthesis C-methylase UbiE